MKGWEIGRIFSFLIENRALRSFAPSGQRLKPKEAEMAKYWEFGATEEEHAFFDIFLEAQGFRVKRYDSFEVPGIPKDHYVFLLLRHGSGELSTWASSNQAVEQVRWKQEPKDHARTWLALLWFSMLHLQYQRIGRGMSEVSRYQEAMLGKDELAESVRETVESQRKLEAPEPSTVREIILGNGNPRIPNRVTNYISYLVDIGHLVEVETGVYQQTLLAAAEMGVNLDDGVNLLYSEDEPMSESKDQAKPFEQMEQAFTLANNAEIGIEAEF